MAGYQSVTERVFLYGSTEEALSSRHLTAGPFHAKMEAGALRAVSFGALELIRQIDFPVRDENWASLTPTTLSETIHEDEQGFRFEHRFEVAGGALECSVIYAATRDGQVWAEGTATAKRDFVTNRTGFSVLHPLADFVGRPVIVRHSGGNISQTGMPDLISPSQPIKDISGLEFKIGDVRLDISFQGEVFEMEDQRNWSDASYKTYCRPLIEPFAYTIRAGETLRQSIRVTVTGEPPKSHATPTPEISFNQSGTGFLPELSLAVQDGWFADDAALGTLKKSGIKNLLLRVTKVNAEASIELAVDLANGLGASVDLEIVLDDQMPAARQLQSVASVCEAAGLSPQSVIALPHAFLTSYQPSSVWPKGVQPEDGFAAARDAFPEARIGAGMLTNFTEFNRCPPNDIRPDFIAHGNSATVHAADDSSVMQILETLPHIFRSARSIGGDVGYRLGLTAIGMRNNPYGSQTSPNPDQRRLTMSVWDPRARALFGAAWAVGVIAATQEQGVEAIALAAPTGPFGILSTPAEVQRPWFDVNPDALVYPIFHVLRALRDGGERVNVGHVPSGLAAVAVQRQGRTRLVVANLTAEPRTLSLPQGEFAELSSDSFSEAASDAEWLDGALQSKQAQEHQFPPFAILFGDMIFGR